MPIKIENETHWRTADLRRVIVAALEAGGFNTKEDDYEVSVLWTTTPHVSVHTGASSGAVWVPRRGPKVPHPVPMVAVAVSALDAPADATLLAYSESFRIGNLLAWTTSKGHTLSEERLEMIEAGARHPEMPPAWSPADLFTIQKYKDPKKDGAYLDFVEKKEKKLRHFDKIIEDTAGEIAKLQARLQRAKANKTKAEKSLRDARTRRS